MKKIIGLIIILMVAFVCQPFAQTINKVEYFVDADPGFGNGTNVSITAASDISNLLIAVNINSLSKGFHNINVRSKDNNGNWSLTNRWLFVKDVLATVVNKLECFVDTDPGFGNATNVIISSSANVSNVLIPVDISGLSRGFHNIYLRSRDDAGNWTLTNRWLFVKDALATAVNKIEFFVDIDPGFGNGTNVSISSSANIPDVLIPVDISALNKGFHNIYLRTKDNAGNWTLTNRWLFFKDIAQGNLQGGEYFFDTDPGFGNGNPIPFGGGLVTNILDFSFGASVSGLIGGPHYLFIRTREINGKWSLTNVVPFNLQVVVPVTLIKFQVKPEGKKAKLTWQTATEQNSNRFDIEKSFDGYHFEKIASVRAAGNSNTIIEYSYFDLAPKNGINYYRLREVDSDNHLQFSETKTAQFGSEVLFALYNNPSNGTDIKLTVNIFPSTISVFDATGKKMREINITRNAISIPVTRFAGGTYLAVLSQAGKIIVVEKFIVY